MWHSLSPYLAIATRQWRRRRKRPPSGKIWAALEMYPAMPGADVLALHGPSFSSILIQRSAYGMG